MLRVLSKSDGVRCSSYGVCAITNVFGKFCEFVEGWNVGSCLGSLLRKTFVLTRSPDQARISGP